MTTTGSTAGDIDVIIDGTNKKVFDAKANAIPSMNLARPAIVQPGDLWLLDDHRLLCGDATKRECFETLMAGTKAQMVITDLPYNVPIDGHVSGLGTIRHCEFAMASAR